MQLHAGLATLGGAGGDRVQLDLLGRQAPLHGRVTGKVETFLDAEHGRTGQLVDLETAVDLSTSGDRVVTDLHTLDALHDRTTEGHGGANTHLETAGIGRLVAEHDQVEGFVALEFPDRGGDRLRRALGIPLVGVGLDEHTMGRADRDCVAQLLLGITRAQREHGDFAAVLFDELHGTFDSALLVRARGEPEVGGIDVLPVGGHVDLCARRGHPLHTAENLHDCSGSALQTGVFGIEGRATAHDGAGVELVHVHRLQLGAGHGQLVGQVAHEQVLAQ